MKKAKSKYSGTVGSAVSDAFGILEELAEEMREAYDNTPESLQSSPVGEARGEAADALESITEADVPKKFDEVMVKFDYVPVKRPSRAARCSEAVEILTQAISALEELEGDDDDDRDDTVSEIQTIIDEAEGVYFPGMFG